MCCSVGGISLPKEKYDKKKSSKTHVLSVVGYFICYCLKLSSTVMIDKVRIIVSATKECIWIEIEGGVGKISRHKNNVNIHKTLNR